MVKNSLIGLIVFTCFVKDKELIFALKCLKRAFFLSSGQIKLFSLADIEDGSLSGTFLVLFCHFELLLIECG